MSKTDPGMPNNTYFNNFVIFNKVFKKQFEIKNFVVHGHANPFVLDGGATMSKHKKPKCSVLPRTLNLGTV